jgi:hypothetical protein
MLFFLHKLILIYCKHNKVFNKYNTKAQDDIKLKYSNKNSFIFNHFIIYFQYYLVI